MSAHAAYIGLGSNLGDRVANLAGALAALHRAGRVRCGSALYRTHPWGKRDQPDFYNAVVELETSLSPLQLLEALRAIEMEAGRVGGERWGPRVLDLDVLTYDDLAVAQPDLEIPHPRLAERAFVLVPLAELNARFVPLRDALGAAQLAGVVAVDGLERARFDRALRESENAMPAQKSSQIVERVRALAGFLREAGAARLRIARSEEEIELARRPSGRPPREGERSAAQTPARVDTIRADIVGIFHLSRPAPAEGQAFDDDRELGYIEALGIRTPVRSLGGGRLVSVAATEAAAVEYGQALFLIARG